MLARLGGLDHDLLVHVGGGVDAHRVHVRAGEERVQVLLEVRAEFLGPGAAARGLLVPHAGDLHIFHLGKVSGVFRRVHVPLAEHGHMKHIGILLFVFLRISRIRIV